MRSEIAHLVGQSQGVTEMMHVVIVSDLVGAGGRDSQESGKLSYSGPSPEDFA